jgi:hypothetical protein
MVSIAPFIMVIMIVSVLAKLFPVMPMWEIEHEKAKNENE